MRGRELQLHTNAVRGPNADLYNNERKANKLYGMVRRKTERPQRVVHCCKPHVILRVGEVSEIHLVVVACVQDPTGATVVQRAGRRRSDDAEAPTWDLRMRKAAEIRHLKVFSY